MSANQFAEDDRVQWIRQRVALALNLSPAAFDEYFADSLDRARSAGIARETIFDYLNNKDGNGSVLFFSCNKWFDEIEGMLSFIVFSLRNIPYLLLF